jgi:hypothetical protein
MRKFWGAALLASLALLPACGPAHAHGGGGGGGGGHGSSGHYVYVPVYGGIAVPMVPPAQVGSYSNIHTVAVLSGVGQTMTLGKAALLTPHSTFSIADWNLDRAIEDSVSRDMATHYTVKPVAHDSAALAAIPNGHYDTSSAKALQAYIIGLDDHSVDAFVVIRPDAETDTPVTPGLALDATDSGARPREEANFEIDLVNPQSGMVFAHAFSRATDRQGVPVQFATFWGSPDVRVMPNDVPSNAQRIQLKKDFERNVSLTLRETLRSLNLGIKLPDVGARTITPLTADENPATKLPRVMVVSALGDSVEVDYPGTLFSKRKDQNFQVADWALDAEFEKRALAVLDKHFTPVTVPVDRAKLAALIVGDTNVAAAPVPGITPGTPGVDLYVVLVKMRGKTNDNTAGLTLWSRGSEDYGAIFSQYAVLLVEPKTGRTAFAVPGAASPKFPSPLPDRMIAKSNLPNPGAAGFAPDQQSAAHILFTQMMNDSIEETLLRLRLTGQKIEAGGADIAQATVGDGTKAEPAQAPN